MDYYTPAFKEWLALVKAKLPDPEIEDEDAWDLYDDGCSVEDAVTILKEY